MNNERQLTAVDYLIEEMRKLGYMSKFSINDSVGLCVAIQKAKEIEMLNDKVMFDTGRKWQYELMTLPK